MLSMNVSWPFKSWLPVGGTTGQAERLEEVVTGGDLWELKGLGYVQFPMVSPCLQFKL